MKNQIRTALLGGALIALLTSSAVIAQDGSGSEILTNDKVITMVKAGLPASLIVKKIHASKTNHPSNTGEFSRWQSQKEVMTNADIVQLVKLGFGEAVIIQKIRLCEPKFDTSNSALAQLKAANVSDSIIMEMISPGSSSSVGTAKTSNQASNTVVRQPSMNDPFGIAQPATLNVSSSGSVLLIDADKRIELKYSTPDMRTNSMLGAMVNPLHKSRVRAALKGNHASLRITNNLPLFEISIEKDANPADVVAIVKLEPKSDTREIEQGRGGITGVSTGFRKQDVIPANIEETATNQSLKLYRIKLVNPLVPGEYALVYRGVAYYDFGVDGTK